MRTLVVYEYKRKKRWVYMPFPTKKSIRDFLRRTKKAGIKVTIKLGGF